MAEWILASERQPDTDREVLAHAKMEEYVIASWSGNSWHDSHGTFMAGVTHWMELPELPNRG